MGSTSNWVIAMASKNSCISKIASRKPFFSMVTTLGIKRVMTQVLILDDKNLVETRCMVVVDVFINMYIFIDLYYTHSLLRNVAKFI